MPGPTEAQLTEEIRRLLVPAGRCRPEDVGPFARTILLYFRNRSEVLDARLASEDRGRFYMLEDVGLLSVWEDEVYVGKGRRWRVHRWRWANGFREP